MDSASHDHVVIVTGAAAGLGRTMALGLLAAGRRVAGVDIEPSRAALEAMGADPSAGGRFLPVIASVRSEADARRAVAETVAHFGHVDALINNAGLGMNGIRPNPGQMAVPFYDVPVDKWHAVIDTNVNGPFLMAHAVAPELIKQRWGRIINVTTSYPTMLRGGNSPYGVSKAAMEAAAVIWSQDLEPANVTVNVLIPGGASDTAMVPHESVPDRATLIAPSVMVAPAVWLTSHAADGVTGMRFIGRDWTPGAPDSDNLAKAGALAGWRTKP